MSLVTVLTPFLLLGLAVAAPQEDLIADLPGLDYSINFKQYSGYLSVTEGKHLHYWFTESQNDPSTDPLVLWLNGGPGCSSVGGLITENGPFLVKPDGSGLYENAYGWNQISNTLYLESPACVGFSYDDNNECLTGDAEVAQLNYEALKQFFKKFPEYRGHDFFITGESYAGVYIPTLSVKIVEGNADYPIEFRGYAIGNGLLNYKLNANSAMFFGHYHAIIGDDLWNEMVQRCCQDGVEGKDTCNFFPSSSKRCDVSVLKAAKIMYLSGINIYNIYQKCEHSSTRNPARYRAGLISVGLNTTYVQPDLQNDPMCVDEGAEETYLNYPDVRAALHIPTHVQEWEECSDGMVVFYERTVFDVSPQLKYLNDNKIRGLIYNGDVDMVCNFLGNEWVVDDLALQSVEPRRTWTEDGQVAGFVERYDGLDFVTVKGSGHMVPQDKPGPAYGMFKSFILNEPY